MSETFNIHARLTAADEASGKIRGAAETANRSFRDLAMGISGVATAGFSLYQSFDSLQKVQLRVQTAQKNLTSAQASAEAAQRTYNAAVEKYGENSQQAEEAALRLQAAQQQLQIATQQVGIAQGDYNQAVARFALMIGPQAMTMYGGLSKAMGGFHGQIPGGISGIRGLTGAFRGLYLAMGPIGIALIAITAAVALFTVAWNENWFGIREKTAAVIDTLTGIWNNILLPGLRAIGEGVLFLASVWRSAWDAIGSGMRWVYDNIIRPVAGSILSIIDRVVAAWNRLTAIGGMVTGAAATVGRAIGIPGLQAGGIVTRPTLAMLGEAGPEAVIPLRQVGASMPMMGTPINLTATFTITPEAIDRLLMGFEHRQYVKLTGRIR